MSLTSIAVMSLVAAWYFLRASRSFFTESDASLPESFTADRGSRTFKRTRGRYIDQQQIRVR